jgi:hypothetical protein
VNGLKKLLCLLQTYFDLLLSWVDFMNLCFGQKASRQIFVLE